MLEQEVSAAWSLSETGPPASHGLVPEDIDFADAEVNSLEDQTSGSEAPMNPQARALVRELMADAYARGFPHPVQAELRDRRLDGGMSAEVVALVQASTYTVAKVDSSPSLKEEIEVLDLVRTYLSESQQHLFPRVFAEKTDSPPYAYLMEYFPRKPRTEHVQEFPADSYLLLESCLFMSDFSEEEIRTLTQTLADSLLDLYNSTKNHRLRPSSAQIYYGRLRSRTDEILELEESEVGFSPDALCTTEITYKDEALGSSRELPPLEELLSKLEGGTVLEDLDPGFATFVHGDAHPGNILVRKEDDGYDFKLIDPKGWLLGDHAFDAGKLIHYILGTGPVELSPGTQPSVRYDADASEVSQDVKVGAKALMASNVLEQRFSDFAATNADDKWDTRFELSMAANLIGVVPGRLREGMIESGIFLYCEGLKRLIRATDALNVV